MKDILTEAAECHWLGGRYRTILSSRETGGAMSITEIVHGPLEGPPRHIHHNEDEIFVIQSGDVEFWLDGQSFVRGPGETAFVPRGTPHAFRVCAGGPARFLCILTPGGFEGFFFEGARNGWEIPRDMAAVVDSAAGYGLEFTGPPIGAE